MSATTPVPVLSPVPGMAGMSPPAARFGFDEPVGAMVQETTTIETGTALGEDFDPWFKGDPELECIVIVAQGIPTHLCTREHYYAKTGGPYGFAFFQKKPAEVVAQRGAAGARGRRRFRPRLPAAGDRRRAPRGLRPFRSREARPLPSLGPGPRRLQRPGRQGKPREGAAHHPLARRHREPQSRHRAPPGGLLAGGGELAADGEALTPDRRRSLRPGRSRSTETSGASGSPISSRSST
jgi:hypothetical protein